VVPIRISLIEGCCWSYWTKGSLWLSWSHHFDSFKVATMTWLTVTEYQCHKWPQICAVCRNHNPVVSSFMTYQWVCNKSNMTGATCGPGTAHPSEKPEFDPVFSLFQWNSCQITCLLIFSCVVMSTSISVKKQCSLHLDSLLFCRGFMFIYVICIYLHILVYNMVFISDDVRVR